MSQAKIILIAGPTASGKSSFALDLAHKKLGSIINADALQIYAGLPILSSQPSPTDQASVPHLLYGQRPPPERSSAGEWVKLAHASIRETLASGRLPILVGGTGLYFRALLGGLADIPPIPDEVRVVHQKNYDVWGEEKFRHELSKVDPISASKLAPNDRQRLVRAFEVVQHTGKPLSHWHEASQAPSVYSIETHLLMPERSKLYANCDQRFLSMIKQGVLDEVKCFHEKNLDDSLPVMKTLGYRELVAHLNNELSLDEAIHKAQQSTRHYAKRQMTWFRHQWSY